MRFWLKFCATLDQYRTMSGKSIMQFQTGRRGRISPSYLCLRCRPSSWDTILYEILNNDQIGNVRARACVCVCTFEYLYSRTKFLFRNSSELIKCSARAMKTRNSLSAFSPNRLKEVSPSCSRRFSSWPKLKPAPTPFVISGTPELVRRLRSRLKFARGIREELTFRPGGEA